MTGIFNKSAVVVLLVSLTTVGLAAKRLDVPEITDDGLHLVPGSKFTVLYAAPEANLSRYHRVHLTDVYVALKKNWARDQGSKSATTRLHISSKDMEEIKTQLATEFHSVFLDELDSNGYLTSDVVGDDVMIIRPALVNVDINSPNTTMARPTRKYNTSAGEMTLYLELIDSATGELLAKAIDHSADYARVNDYNWSNSVTNRAAAARIFKAWAVNLRDMLDEARQNPDG